MDEQQQAQEPSNHPQSYDAIFDRIWAEKECNDSLKQQTKDTLLNMLQLVHGVDWPRKVEFLLMSSLRIYCNVLEDRDDKEVADLILQIGEAFVTTVQQETSFADLNHHDGNYLGGESAASAFNVPFIDSDGIQDFVRHLKKMKEEYKADHKSKYPFFPIIQSSGYGKSRLMKELAKITGLGFRVVYLCFASEYAYPRSNVLIDVSLDGAHRSTVETAFRNLFYYALGHQQTDMYELKFARGSLKEPPSTNHDDDVLFVVDEASQLLSQYASQRVSFYRCLRQAMKDFVDANTNRSHFFVTVSTSSDIYQTNPGVRYNPCLKVVDDPSDFLEPLQPYLLHNGIGATNNQADILSMDVELCHEPQTLMSMGRPMWSAYLGQVSYYGDFYYFLTFCEAKLFGGYPPAPKDLTRLQIVAILACRAYFTISPESRMSSGLVQSHMATAVNISKDCVLVATSYPSEPALALAAREYMKNKKHEFLLRALDYLEKHFSLGSATKGSQEELIVRLLNLIAMDNCMNTLSYGVKEVKLTEFLSQFDRGDDKSVSTMLSSGNNNNDNNDHSTEPSGKQNQNLKRPWILESEAKHLNQEGEKPTQKEKKEQQTEVNSLWDGTVCFTHFIHLSSDLSVPVITPALLAMAYRRTAAVVIDDDRRGIDWIIPVRIKVKGKSDQFVGLCGLNKDLIGGTVAGLYEPSDEETATKVLSANYFLTDVERKLFDRVGWSLDWPAIMFSVGAAEERAVLAGATDGEGITSFPFPCIILTGLSFTKLVDDDDTNAAIKELLDISTRYPLSYVEHTPLMFGTSADKHN